jgi:hypothetical protein
VPIVSFSVGRLGNFDSTTFFACAVTTEHTILIRCHFLVKALYVSSKRVEETSAHMWRSETLPQLRPDELERLVKIFLMGRGPDRDPPPFLPVAASSCTGRADAWPTGCHKSTTADLRLSVSRRRGIA